MINQEINPQEFNAAFKAYLDKAPKSSLVAIAKRRLGIPVDEDSDEFQAHANQYRQDIANFIAGMPATLHHPESDPKVAAVYRQALDDLSQLTDNLNPNAVWNMAYKYFPDEIKGCRSDDDKRDAIIDAFELPEEDIDAEQELKEIVKNKICETEFTFQGEGYKLFTEAEAQNSTPADLCLNLKKKLTNMSGSIDEDNSDFKIYREARRGHTFADYFRFLGQFLEMKIDEALEKHVYSFVFDPDSESLIGTHIDTSLEVITVSPNIDDEDDTGNPENMLCDISVAGISLPEHHPALRDARDMMEVQRYIMEHGKYAPGRNGEYSIDGVAGSEVPAIAYKAVLDWATAATICKMSTESWKKAREIIGGDTFMDDLKSEVGVNKMYRDYGNATDGISPSGAAGYKKEYNNIRRRANAVKPKIGKPEDVSKALGELQSKLRNGIGWDFNEEDED